MITPLKSADVLAAPGSVAKIGSKATPAGGFCRSADAQAQALFGEIADKAVALEALLEELVQRVDDPLGSSLTVAALALTAQMGLVADIGSDRLGGIKARGANAQDWLLPAECQSDSQGGAHV